MWIETYCLICTRFNYFVNLNFNQMKKTTKHTLLKGEGANQHTLYGQFAVEKVADFPAVIVEKDSLLKHEQPDGSFSNEHNALKISKGDWSLGKQVEYNPFEGRITQVWD